MKIKLFFVLISLIISTKFYAQDINLNQGFAEQKDYFVTIPYTEIQGKIIIEILLNNKFRKFVVDTGAPTSITEKLAQELNPTKLGKLQIRDQSGAIDSTGVVSLSDIKLGSVSFKNIPTIVTKDLIFYECIKVDGLIGSNLLRNTAIQFNSKNKTITLTDNPKKLNLIKKYSNDMELSQGQSSPFFSIKLKKNNIVANEKVLFDTGDDSFYELSISVFNQLTEKALVYDKLAESNGTFTFGLHGAAEIEHQYLLSIPKLEVNKVSFQNVITATTYANRSRIGSPILNYGVITLDYLNKKININPFDDVVAIDLKEKTWAIEPTFKDQKAVVGIIWDNSLNSNVNLGDEILKFNEIDYKNMSFCDIYLSNNKSENEKATVVLKDIKTGEIKNIEISKL